MRTNKKGPVEGRSPLKRHPASQLLRNAEGPLVELLVSRSAWRRNELSKVSIEAAKKLIRRALDELDDPKIIAIGKHKMAYRKDSDCWVPAVHLFVAGASREALKAAFSKKRPDWQDFLEVIKVRDVDETLHRVFSTGFWEHPVDPDEAARPHRGLRSQFDRWKDGLEPGARRVRYGCDRYLNPLRKKARILGFKAKKKRPYPHWLTYHMFGGPKWTARAQNGDWYGVVR